MQQAQFSASALGMQVVVLVQWMSDTFSFLSRGCDLPQELLRS